MNNKKTADRRVQWAKCAIVSILYIAFLYWVGSWWGLIVLPFIYDAYISKKIRWQWWKDEEGPKRWIMSWVDAIVFALVAVYFINQFFFQNFVIPSSSLEKSLLVGDYLCVSKVSYGPRIPQTPLTMPLTQHTLPIVECKSYIEWPQWDYRRVKGLGKVRQNDIVVFNYPGGDTIVSNQRYQAQDYAMLCYGYGEQALGRPENLDSMAAQDRYDYFARAYMAGKGFLQANAGEFGEIATRPADRRENYVKRCVGLPGQTLQIKNRIVYTDGRANKEPDNVQYTYYVKLRTHIPEDMIASLGISNEDMQSLSTNGYMPLTKRAVAALAARKDVVESIEIVTDATDYDVYPLNGNLHWTRDNYGPVWIPAKGKSIRLTLDNIAIYERPIRAYEGNRLEVRGGKIYINGKPAESYTFKLDYYWMMGDNRHCSADSRYWGFVPEDHIVGKPIFIWWSSDPDRHGFQGIRWSRLMSMVDNIK